MVDEKLCDERHDNLSEELANFRDRCDRQHASNESQVVRIHERLDLAQERLTELKDSMNGCFSSAKSWLIGVALTIIVSLLGTIGTLAWQGAAKKTEVADLDKRLTVQLQTSESNNVLLRRLLEKDKGGR